MTEAIGSIKIRNCSNESILCDGNCRNCNRAEVSYLVGGGTTNSNVQVVSVIGELFAGDEFLYCVKCVGIMDYDGCLGNVYINGYETNLGLSCNGLHQGYFQVDERTWEDICDEYDVMVEWCNK